jgi:hypothetical protein
MQLDGRVLLVGLEVLPVGEVETRWRRILGGMGDGAVGAHDVQGADMRQAPKPLRQYLPEGRIVFGKREGVHGIGHALKDEINSLEATDGLFLEEAAESGRPGPPVIELPDIGHTKEEGEEKTRYQDGCE